MSRAPDPPNYLDARYTLPPHRTEGTDAPAATAQTNTDVVRHLLDPATLATLLAMSNPDGAPVYATLTKTRVNDYNALLRSLPAYEKLAASDPGLAQLHLQTLCTSGQRLSTPSPLLRQLRRAQRLNNRQWSIFRSLANLPPLARSPDHHLSATARAAAAADRADATDHSLIALHRSQNILSKQTNRRRGPAHDAHRTAWHHLLHAFLDPAIPTPAPGQLLQVSEAMTGHLAHGLPWTPDDWQRLLDRADLWHRSRLTDAGDPGERAWFDPGPRRPRASHTGGGYLLTPLNTRQRRAAAHALLGFPVHVHLPSVRAGLTQVFLATAPPRVPAAIRLSSESGLWQPAEIATANRRPSEALTNLAEDLAAAFRDAEPPPARQPRPASPVFPQAQ